MKAIYTLLFLLFVPSLAYVGEFEGKKVLITGASRGIGKETAHLFSKEGANLALIANDSFEDLVVISKALSLEYGNEVLALKCDVSKQDEVERAVSKTWERFGGLDVLVNNAGICSNYAAEELPLDEWQRVIDVNLTGPFLCAQEVGKKWIAKGKPGNIINISSMSAFIVVRPQDQCHYNTAKGGLAMLSKSLAVEWAKYNIRVNTVSPGYIMTPLVAEATQWHDEWLSKIPQNVIGEPRDVAEVILFLASDRSKFVTGSDWIIDGGYVCP